MCEHNPEYKFGAKESQAFMKALLEDLRALEVENYCDETGETQIEAEQEMSDRATG